MDKFVEKISGLSYEIFAILMPGIFAIVCSVALVSFYQLLAGLPQCLGERLFRHEIRNHQFFAIIVLVLATYLLGQTSTYLAKTSFESKPSQSPSLSRRLYEHFCKLIWTPDTQQPPEDVYSHVDLNQVTEILRSYGFKIQEVKWRNIYGPASRFIFQLGTRSMIQTYQNKYTLHRTMAMQFSLLSKAIFFLSFIATILLISRSLKTIVPLISTSVIAIVIFLIIFTILIRIAYKFLKITPILIPTTFMAVIFIFGLVYLENKAEHLRQDIIIYGWILSIILFFFQRYFSATFRRFWTEFGSQVCWEVQSLNASQAIGQKRNEP